MGISAIRIFESPTMHLAICVFCPYIQRSLSYSIVTLMHQIENCCEISTQRCCTQLPCVLQFLDFFLLLSNLGHVSYDLGWVRHRIEVHLQPLGGRSQIMSKQMGILIQQSDLQLLFTKNVKLHIELCSFVAASIFTKYVLCHL